MAAVEMLRRLAYNGIEVHQLAEAVTHDGISHPAGTWVIAMDQPFANFVRQLFAVQDYPDLRQYPEGPPDQPYDVAGWTLPYLMGVRVVEAASPLDEGVRGAMTALGTGGAMLGWDADVADAPPSIALGVAFAANPVGGPAIAPAPGRGWPAEAARRPIRPRQPYRAVNQAWPRRAGAVRARRRGGGRSWRHVGSLRDQRPVRERPERPGVPSAHPIGRRGVGFGRSTPVAAAGRPLPPLESLHREGWTRWLLERYGFSYTSLRNADVLAGDLRDRYDVIIVADMGAGQILNGFAKGTVPPRYEGGIGAVGVRALDEFVRSGGTLVTFNNASMFAIEQLHLPVSNVIAGLDAAEYFMSGSIVEMEVDPSHPVMSGMPARAKVVVERSPVFTTEDGFNGAVLAKYPADGSPLLSGYLLGEEHLQGYAAALDVRHGDGHVILLGMRPQWRGQPFGNFRIVFNAALYSEPVAAAAPANPDFWEAPEEEEDESMTEGGR